MFVRQMFFRLNFRLSRCVLTTASNISCQCHKYQISPTFLSHSLKHHYICISDGSNNRYVSESHIPRQLSLALLFFSSAENFTYLSTLFKSASTMYSAAVYHHGKPSCAWVAPQQEIHHQTAKTKSRPFTNHSYLNCYFPFAVTKNGKMTTEDNYWKHLSPLSHN